MRLPAWCAALAALLALTVAPAGGRQPGDTRPRAPLRVLFIGNSLTAANDLPAMVAALAEAGGDTAVETAMVTAANVSLEDHWHRGQAREVIARGGWTWVVLQQGPSALPESRVLLREYARRFDREIRAVGGSTALYMVWPSRARAFDFPGVRESYAAAARDVNGRLLAAGDAWREAWALDPSLPLYGPDGFHPSLEGSYLAAVVVYQGLTGRSPLGLPSRLSVGSGRSAVSIDPAVAELLQRAARTVDVR